MPAFIIIGSTIIPAISPSYRSSTFSSAPRLLNGTMTQRSVMAFGQAAGGRDAGRLLDRADHVEVDEGADHHRVVVPVVAALDLDDPIATGDGPHQVDGVHRRLGARVREAPEREAEALRELVGHDDRVVGGLREVGAERDPLGHRLHDRRVRVADGHGAVAGVEVDVLVAVDVEDARPLAVRHPDRRRPADHPVRRRATGEVLHGPLVHLGGAGLAAEELRLLLRDQPRQLRRRLVGGGIGPQGSVRAHGSHIPWSFVVETDWRVRISAAGGVRPRGWPGDG